MRDFLLRPILESGPADDGAPLAGGPLTFRRIETASPGRAARRLPLKTFSPELLGAYTAARAPFAGVALDRPRLMGVLNVTPDSFSDGGADEGPDAAVRRGLAMVEAGADILDIGGESTRPGAEPVDTAEEIARVQPVIEGLRAAGCAAPISIDSRNAATADAALKAGAKIVNDVSAATHDPEMSPVVVEHGAAICLMHAAGDPRTMQDDPRYTDVRSEVYDHLEARVAALTEAGVPKARIAVDPGIGFGKTIQHNLSLISGLSAFHGLGCVVMIGLSRKGFVGRLSGVREPGDRLAGSIGGALAAAGQGAQIIRVHDVAETRQALDVWTAATGLWETDLT